MTDIDKKLKVGFDCEFMNISAILESKSKLFFALAYTNCDFIYNKEYFQSFVNPKKPEEYISKDNELIILGEIDSTYAKDCYNNARAVTNRIYNVGCKIIHSEKKVDLKKLKEDYLDNGIPVIFPCDHYYAYDDYFKVTKDIMKFHTRGHKAVLIDIDFEKGKAIVLDKFYSFIGEIGLDNFKKVITSPYLSDYDYTIFDKELEEIEEIKGFKKYFLKNIQETLKCETVVDDRLYNKNKRALVDFIHDFEENISYLLKEKGKYAPQFLSKLISQTILQRMSFYNLIKYYSMKIDDLYLDDLVKLVEASKKYWTMMDTFNDKCFLSGKIITDYREKYKDLLNKIYTTDMKIYDIFHKILSDFEGRNT